MKKKAFLLLAIIATIATVVLPMTSVDAASKKKKKTTTTTTRVLEPVNMYVFYAGYCGYCSALHTYLDNELTQDEEYKDKFNVVYIEIADENGSSIDGNNEMYSTVADYFEYESGGIPFYVVGDQYMSGYSEDLQSDIKSMIDEEYNDQKYTDVVSTLINVDDIVAPVESSEETESKKNNNTVGYIVLGVTAVLIVAIIFGRSKTSYYEEEK